MANYVRKNAWNNNGTFDNEDLLWYAKGVGAMQAKALDDQNSWWFFAAIHGEYLSESSFPGWGDIPGFPEVPTSPEPSAKVQDTFWNQCQHQSWFFPPWHRGYLIALEGQVRAEIIKLGGPEDWALPYWNYLGGGDENQMPPAFAEEKLPDGNPNPLFVTARYGPDNDGNIYITNEVNQDCQTNTLYTGSNAATDPPGYGGPKTGFSHDGNTSGNMESNPHNDVHVEVGGIISDTKYGLMADPGTAGLDPIFYLHHCNIDRLWASWNAVENENPTEDNWLYGPASTGEREFVMPMADGSSWVFTPADVKSIDVLDYSYEYLTPATREPQIALTSRLTKLGAAVEALQEKQNMDFGKNSELMGANDGSQPLGANGLSTKVKLDNRTWKSSRLTLTEASVNNLPDQVYLQLENVTGKMDANFLTVEVNSHRVGRVSLFGLRKASKKDDHHAGSGLTFNINITSVIDDLHLQKALDIDTLDVNVRLANSVDSNDITVGRVSVYREQQEI